MFIRFRTIPATGVGDARIGVHLMTLEQHEHLVDRGATGLYFRGQSRRVRRDAVTSYAFRTGADMKIRNSLRSLIKRHRDNRMVRRKGRIYIINKTNPRYKARQG